MCSDKRWLISKTWVIEDSEAPVGQNIKSRDGIAPHFHWLEIFHILDLLGNTDSLQKCSTNSSFRTGFVKVLRSFLCVLSLQTDPAIHTVLGWHPFPFTHAAGASVSDVKQPRTLHSLCMKFRVESRNWLCEIKVPVDVNIYNCKKNSGTENWEACLVSTQYLLVILIVILKIQKLVSRCLSFIILQSLLTPEHCFIVL